eukprot:707577-Amphidinium_carterae.1
MAAVSVLPSDAELAAIASLADMVAWVGIPDQAWVAMSGALGTVPDFRILALVPTSAMTQAARLAQVHSRCRRNLRPVLSEIKLMSLRSAL